MSDGLIVAILGVVAALIGACAAIIGRRKVHEVHVKTADGVERQEEAAVATRAVISEEVPQKTPVSTAKPPAPQPADGLETAFRNDLFGEEPIENEKVIAKVRCELHKVGPRPSEMCLCIVTTHRVLFGEWANRLFCVLSARDLAGSRMKVREGSVIDIEFKNDMIHAYSGCSVHAGSDFGLILLNNVGFAALPKPSTYKPATPLFFPPSDIRNWRR